MEPEQSPYLGWLRRLGIAAAAAVVVGFLYSALTAAPYARPLVIAVMPPGTSWYVFAATLSQLLEPRLPQKGSVEIFARGGGTGNPTLVERGKATVALSQVATAVWAWNGHPIAYQGTKHRRIRALVGGLNSVWMTAVAREGYIRQSGNDTLEKMLRAQPAPRIIMKPPGSTVPVAVDIILAFYGITRADIISRGGSIIQISANQIPDMLGDGRADLYFETAIKGHPALTEAATLSDIRFLDFDPSLLAELERQGMRPTPLPAWFRGQTHPTQSADCGTVLIARDDLADDLAYLITKTICEQRSVMIQAHKAWTDFEPSRSWRPEATGIPLHPGSIRYFKERGWL
ncbi:MAG TPA: TAXI family TRAP transporter solute-binding subunit [Bryobacteraceae bacterium]|nr:TAXI family TRAP transporter solute-binding subunit [Bryobacteraceae bacterium]